MTLSATAATLLLLLLTVLTLVSETQGSRILRDGSDWARGRRKNHGGLVRSSPVRAAAASNETVLTCLRGAELDGRLVLPWDPDYQTARQVFSKFYQVYPAAVVRAVSINDVSKTLRCGASFGVHVSPRSGRNGHESGSTAVNGGITLDLSAMAAVTLDEASGVVAVQAGATVGKIVRDLYLQSGGRMSVPLGRTPTDGAGLILSCGLGFNTRFSGLACDRIASLTVVKAPDGAVIDANETVNPEIFAAARGGRLPDGVVVTEFRLETFDSSSDVVAFSCRIPTVDTQAAIEAVSFYQNWSIAMDSRATPNLRLDPDSGNALVSGWFWGDPAEFCAALGASGLDDSTPIGSSDFEMNVMSMLNASLALSGWNTTSLDSLLDGYAWERSFFKSESFWLSAPLPVNAIGELLAFANATGRQDTWFEFQALGGNGSAVATDGASSGSGFAHRNAGHRLVMQIGAATFDEGLEALGKMAETRYNIGAIMRCRGGVSDDDGGGEGRTPQCNAIEPDEMAAKTR